MSAHHPRRPAKVGREDGLRVGVEYPPGPGCQGELGSRLHCADSGPGEWHKCPTGHQLRVRFQPSQLHPGGRGWWSPVSGLLGHSLRGTQVTQQPLLTPRSAGRRHRDCCLPPRAVPSPAGTEPRLPKKRLRWVLPNHPALPAGIKTSEAAFSPSSAHRKEAGGAHGAGWAPPCLGPDPYRRSSTDTGNPPNLKYWNPIKKQTSLRKTSESWMRSTAHAGL